MKKGKGIGREGREKKKEKERANAYQLPDSGAG